MFYFLLLATVGAGGVSCVFMTGTLLGSIYDSGWNRLARASVQFSQPLDSTY